VKQHGEFPGHGHDGALLRVLAAPSGQFLAPTSQSGVSAQRPEDMLGTLHQRLPKVAIAGLGDAQLGIVLARLRTSRAKSQVAPHIPALGESRGLSERRMAVGNALGERAEARTKPPTLARPDQAEP